MHMFQGQALCSWNDAILLWECQHTIKTPDLDTLPLLIVDPGGHISDELLEALQPWVHVELQQGTQRCQVGTAARRAPRSWPAQAGMLDTSRAS